MLSMTAGANGTERAYGSKEVVSQKPQNMRLNHLNDSTTSFLPNDSFLASMARKGENPNRDVSQSDWLTTPCL